MPATPWGKTITISGTPTKINATKLIMNVSLFAKETNSGSITIAMGGTSSSIRPGVAFPLKNVDLSEILVSGTVSDILDVFGNTAC